MSTISIVDYYKNLLIIQYRKPRATATVEAQTTPLILPQTSKQRISFAPVPTSGSFTLTFNGSTSAPVAWDADNAAVTAAIRGISGLGDAEVSGSPTVGYIDVRFVGVPPVAPLMTIASTLDTTPRIADVDLTLPLAVENAFNLLGDDLAKGVQLDVIGKYVGAKRLAQGLSQTIRLNDTDYATLIKMAIVRNSSKTDLASVQDFIAEFFPDQIRVFDYKTMRVSFVVAESVGSRDLIEMLVAQNLLPIPMAVLVSSVIYAPGVQFFGCCSYELPIAEDVWPLNTYDDYRLDWPWLSYDNVLM